MAWDDIFGGGNDFDTRSVSGYAGYPRTGLGGEAPSRRRLGPSEMVSNMSDYGRIRRLMNSFGQPAGDYEGSQFDPRGQGESEGARGMGAEEEPFDFGKFLMQGLANSAGAGQDFTQPVPIAGAQNVGVQRGNPLQTLLSIIQRRRQGLQGRQGQQGLLQSGFTGRL